MKLLIIGWKITLNCGKSQVNKQVRLERVNILTYIQGDPALYPIDWSPDKIQEFKQTLLSWYDATKRDLPWRNTNDPYKIWVSEIMLQQTQVITVIPYYERFIETLPTIQDLAQADEDVLLSLWQGLGYYSRVRNMQVAAKQVMENFHGEMPRTMKELLTLKGIGPYTAAAIGSIAFGLVEPAIDGNLMRVTARLFELEADIAQVKSRKLFAAILYQLIDSNRPGDFNQALMDLGATIMTPANLTPEANPLKAFDQSYQNGTAHLYPVKKKKTKATQHQLLAYIVQNSQGDWLVRKHEEGELLTGLWHFPMIEQTLVMEAASAEELVEPFKDWWSEQLDATDVEKTIDLEETGFAINQQLMPFGDVEGTTLLPIVKHVFSHRIWDLQLVPIIMTGIETLPFDSELMRWQKPKEIRDLPVSTLQQKLLLALENYL